MVCIPADVLRFDLADGSRVSLRPSGTEPLIKGYIEVVGDVCYSPTRWCDCARRWPN